LELTLRIGRVHRKRRVTGRGALIAGCATIFWPGAFIFSFPGVLGPHWQQAFQVGRAAVGQTLFFVLAAVVGYAFGTLFAVSAPLASDYFGLTHFGAIYGLIFTAYGFVAGPLGPWLSGLALDATGGNFKLVFSYLGALCAISTICVWLMRIAKGNVRATR
jgi:MFS family permease